jgi:transposase-like protein
MVGTIFENSATSLRLWFQAINLMASTRCGISAKQLERELGVTYKTAWRMLNEVRSLFDQAAQPFDGTVEMDEIHLGGKAKWMHKDKREERIQERGPVGKPPVFGMARRGTGKKDGRVMAKVVEDATADTLLSHIKEKVLPRSVVPTDEWRCYDRLGKIGYEHSRVAHTQSIYVSRDMHTNTIEGFWSLLRRGIGGVHHAVSDRYLQAYLDGYVFRCNNRDAGGRGMFSVMLDRIEKAPAEPRQLALPEGPTSEQPA